MYRIIGAELSPYSVKVRSYFRFKDIPHQWISRSMAVQEQYKEYFKIPIIPVVITPDDQSIQDSTPIIESLEKKFPEKSIYPADSALKFISQLLEEFGDEWANKWMFHMRWARDADVTNATTRIAHMTIPEADEGGVGKLAGKIRERMLGRVFFVGSNAQNAAEIEAGFDQALSQLDAHLEDRPYMMGGRPSFADFGLFGQIYNAWIDTTAGALIGAKYANVLSWIQRMAWPRIEGEFETWDIFAPTLGPFLTDQVGGRFLPWSAANLTALEDREEEFTVKLAGHNWIQKPQKYHAKSLMELRRKYAAIADHSTLKNILDETCCLAHL